MANRLDPEFTVDLFRAKKCLTEVAAARERASEARIVNKFNNLSFFGSAESSLQDLTTVDGASIWAGDVVHLKSNAMRVSARKLMTEVEKGDGVDEPSNKRARLESVIPAVPVPAPSTTASTQAAPPPPIQRPVTTPLWLSGQLPPPSVAVTLAAKVPHSIEEARTEAVVAVGAQEAHVAAVSAAVSGPPTGT